MQTVIMIFLVAIVYVMWRKYLKYKSALIAYMRYLDEQGIKEPTAEKVKEYQQWALEKMVKDFFKLR